MESSVYNSGQMLQTVMRLLLLFAVELSYWSSVLLFGWPNHPFTLFKNLQTRWHLIYYTLLFELRKYSIGKTVHPLSVKAVVRTLAGHGSTGRAQPGWREEEPLPAARGAASTPATRYPRRERARPINQQLLLPYVFNLCHASSIS